MGNHFLDLHETLGAATPEIVKEDLQLWLAAVQAANGAGCYQPATEPCNHSDTGGLLLGLKFVGKDTDDSAVQNALAFLNTYWPYTPFSTWYGNFGHPYAMWSVYKGLEVNIGLDDTTHITNLYTDCGESSGNLPGNPSGSRPCNWWEDYNEYLVASQSGDGSWPGYSYWFGPLATAFNVNILGATLIPVAEEDVAVLLNEQGSLVVYPLLDSLTEGKDTIINLANTGDRGTWLHCNAEVHGADATSLVKDDFQIYLTPFQKIWWKLSKGYSAHKLANKFGLPQFSIPPYPDSKGFLYCWTMDGKTQLETTWNHIKGDALVYGNGQAFQYNGIPHQRLPAGDDVEFQDGVLALDGLEYSMGTSRIWFEGIAAGVDLGEGGVGGTLVLASIDADFRASLQTTFDVNCACWNRKEQSFSRHREIHVFAQHDLAKDIKMDMNSIRSDAFMCAADTHLHGDGRRTPVWAIFSQSAGSVNWGTNLWQDQNPLYSAPTAIVLPDNFAGF